MTRRARRRVVTGGILGVGFSAALAVYQFAPPDEGLPQGYDVTQTKRYRHELELYGGKANVELDEFRRWFQSLWHGRSLAGTIVCLSVMSVVAIRFFGRAENSPDDPPGA